MSEAEIFLGSELEQPRASDALFHVIPVPYEASVSYGGGTAAGPAAIIAASQQLETRDQLGSEPGHWGIYTQEPVDCRGTPEALMARLRQLSGALVERGQIPVVLGGEHSLSYGTVMGAVDGVGGRLGVVQIDAHADLRQDYEGSIWSHACVMKRLVDEGLPLAQLGTRAVSSEEQALREARPTQIHYVDARQFCNPPQHGYALPADFPEHIYLSVDIDGLDSAVMPATGTPVPGGLGWWQLLDVVADIARQRRIVAFDVVEFAPLAGFHSYDFLAADLVYKLMGIVGRSRFPQS